MQSLFTILFFLFLEGAYIKINTKIEKEMHTIWKTAKQFGKKEQHAMSWHTDTTVWCSWRYWHAWSRVLEHLVKH